MIQKLHIAQVALCLMKHMGYKTSISPKQKYFAANVYYFEKGFSLSNKIHEFETIFRL